ncbi:hypothetical protein AAKU67_004062 [Oxalobacteraceae bacterium GrIS 2.11]
MTRLLISLLVLGASAATVEAANITTTTPPVTRPVFGPLNSTQQQQIQLISRAVLAAKSVPQGVVEEEQLRDQLHNLHDAIDTVLKPGSASRSSISIQSEAKPGNQVTPQSAFSAASSRFAPSLSALHGLRMNVEQMRPDENVNPILVNRVQRQSKLAAQVELDVTSALTMVNEADRYQKLAEIRNQLHAYSTDEWRAELLRRAVENGQLETPPAPTPTMSTLTKHQTGLAGIKPGKH